MTFPSVETHALRWASSRPAALRKVLALDHAAHAHVRDLHHQAHRADVGDDAVEFVRIMQLCEVLEVFEQFDLFGFASSASAEVRSVSEMWREMSRSVACDGVVSQRGGGFTNNGCSAR